MQSSRSVDFALVGGGIVGACLADELAGRGASVLVLDAGPTPGHATNCGAGIAVPPLRYLSDPEFYGWLRFARSCLDEDLQRLEPEYGTFSMAKPILRALRPAAVQRFDDKLDAGRWVDQDELGTVAAGMTLPPDRRYLLDDGLLVDGRRYLDAVRARCLGQGVAWWQNTLVRYVDQGVVVTESGAVRADRVVFTAGAWTSAEGLAKGTGVRPQRGQFVHLESTVDLPCTLSSTLSLAQGVGGRIVVGATEEDVGFTPRVTTEAVTRLMMFATRTMPELAQSTPVELRAGLRPTTGTGRPVVGRLPGRERVFVSAGHAGHGLLSARCTAKAMVAGLLDADWDRLPHGMCPTEAIGR